MVSGSSVLHCVASVRCLVYQLYMCIYMCMRDLQFKFYTRMHGYPQCRKQCRKMQLSRRWTVAVLKAVRYDRQYSCSLLSVYSCSEYDHQSTSSHRMAMLIATISCSLCSICHSTASHDEASWFLYVGGGTSNPALCMERESSINDVISVAIAPPKSWTSSRVNQRAAAASSPAVTRPRYSSPTHPKHCAIT